MPGAASFSYDLADADADAYAYAYADRIAEIHVVADLFANPVR